MGDHRVRRHGARYYTHHPEDELTPWDGGPYPGWGINGWTRGSSPQYWHDAELLQDALSYTLRKQEEVLDEAGTEGDAGDDEAAEEGED